jgi:hypothetical protein
MLTVLVTVPPTANVTDAVLGETYAGRFRFDEDAAVTTGTRMLKVAFPVPFDCDPEPPNVGEGEAAGTPRDGGAEPPPPPQPITATAMTALNARCKRFISVPCLFRGLGW